MAQVILVTSGKGGVGKSVVCAHLGRALAENGKSVLLAEGARRSLDVLFGLADSVLFDLEDAANGRCELSDAVLDAGFDGRLGLLCGPLGEGEGLDADLYRELVEALDEHFDFILIEADGSDPKKLEPFAQVCDRAILVTTADRVSVRMGRADSDYLAAQGISDIRLCVNMLSRDFERLRPVPDLDWVIDNVCAQLVAVVPFDLSLTCMQEIGKLSDLSNLAKMVFDNFAQRILGNYIDLLIQ